MYVSHVIDSLMNAKEEIGRIIDDRHFSTICEMYDSSKDSIAEVIIGGRDQFDAQLRYIPPTVLRMKDTTCPLMTEELFSSILPCYAVDSYKDGIELCNQREKPLALYLIVLFVSIGIFSQISRKKWRISASLRILEALQSITVCCTWFIPISTLEA